MQQSRWSNGSSHGLLRFILEKRFDDFSQLHSDLKEVDPGMSLGTELELLHTVAVIQVLSSR